MNSIKTNTGNNNKCHENKIEKLSIKEVAYDLVKHELMVKVLMINKYLLDTDESFLKYIKRKLTYYKEKNYISIDYINSIVNFSPFSHHTNNLIEVLNSTFVKGALGRDSYLRLINFFEMELTIHSILKTKKKESLNSYFSDYLSLLIEMLTNDEELKCFTYLDVLESKYYISNENKKKLSKNEIKMFGCICFDL